MSRPSPLALGALGFVVGVYAGCGASRHAFVEPQPTGGEAGQDDGNSPGASGAAGAPSEGGSGSARGGSSAATSAGGSGPSANGASANGGSANVGGSDETAGAAGAATDACSPNPCKNGGTCSGDGSCKCVKGSSGDHCEINPDDCMPNPCKNGGVCSDGLDAHTCECSGRYTGPACDQIELFLAPAQLGDETVSTALSNDGRVAVSNTSDDAGEYIGLLVDFESTDLVQVAELKPSARHAFGVDSDGTTIVGEVLAAGEWSAFKRVGETASFLETDPLPASSFGSSIARDVSADGSTIVGSIPDDTGLLQAFSCRAGACEYIADWPASDSAHNATSVSGDGGVIVGSSTGGNGSNVRAWRYTRATKVTTTLPLLAGTWLRPSAESVSRNGNVVVGGVTINGVLHAVRWSGANPTAQDLGTGVAFGTNADGSVTVGADNSNEAVVWLDKTKHTLASLLGANPDLIGVSLEVANAVSDDGKVIAGTARVSGKRRAFMARLP